jgi:hypothetical protein
MLQLSSSPSCLWRYIRMLLSKGSDMTTTYIESGLDGTETYRKSVSCACIDLYRIPTDLYSCYCTHILECNILDVS